MARTIVIAFLCVLLIALAVLFWNPLWLQNHLGTKHTAAIRAPEAPTGQQANSTARALLDHPIVTAQTSSGLVGSASSPKVQAMSDTSRVGRSQEASVRSLAKPVVRIFRGNRVYRHIGADPAALLLPDQIDQMDIPPFVKNELKREVSDGKPDSIWIVSTKEHPYYFNIMTWGGRVSHVFKVWHGRIKCDWRDAKTGARIDSTRAVSYPPVTYQGTTYALVQILACTNAGMTITPPPTKAELPHPPPARAEIPPTPPVPVPPVPPEQPKPPSPTPPPAKTIPPTEIPFEPGEHANWVTNGTTYATAEYVDGQNDGDHLNAFAGTEIIVRKSYGNHNLGFVFRLGGGALGAPDSKGNFQTAGGFARIGIRRPLFTPTAWNVSLEAGGYGQVDGLVWRDEQGTHWQERRSYSPDAGGYLRTVGYGPQILSWDARIATGKTLQRETEAEASVSPGPFVLKGALRDSYRRDREVHSNGRKFVFQPSTFRTREAAVGVRLKANHILSVGWNEWKYYSPAVWEFDWQGPSVSYDWKINLPWRFRLQVIDFLDTHERDLRTGQTYNDNRHVRFNTGVNFDF